MATAEQIVHVSEFTNEPFIDFTKPENRSRMEEALKKAKAEFGREYPMWLNGHKVTTVEKRTSTNPSRPLEIIGVFQNATAEMARQAVEDAHKYFDTWKRVSAQERVKCLFRAAQIVRERKFELNALVCYEVGKTWVEADADIAETIDFLEFYGREMLRLGEPQKLTPMRGERNYLVYIPLGVGVVIPPWNFPCAIMAGMTAASLVTGNTVVLKPAADSPTIAAKFIDILFEAGIPKEAVNFITGWAAKTESWWTKRPISTRRWKARCKRRSDIKGRNVRRAHARSSPKRFTTPLCKNWWNAQRKSRWARATIRTITWARSSASRR